MNNQEAKFEVADTLSLIAEATNFWQGLNVEKLEELSSPELDELGEPSTNKAA
ncbi:MAG: hypothetical protein ACTID4_04665 [Hafnia alvei]|uniref:hypothetical protein n=1 Tax=Hafnia alvei TaxID=569 RepID=UPI003F8EC8FE